MGESKEVFDIGGSIFLVKTTDSKHTGDLSAPSPRLYIVAEKATTIIFHDTI